MCGSGTTLVVASKLGRLYVGIDLNPEYVDIAKSRLARVLITDKQKE
ncbi:MAG: DNA methyltransferase [Nitrososphaerota archaeon]